MNWIDLHTHLDKLEEGPEKALELAGKVGIHKVITIGTEPDDLPVVLDLAKKYPGQVYCTLGIHPHEGVLYSEETGTFIRAHLNDPGVVALGEMGLDYYYNQSPVEEQKKAFRAQLEIAIDSGLPVEIHTRDAEADTIEILKEFNGKITGLIHCFTGTQWLADQALALGLNISISGIVTFKNAEALRNVVRSIPLDRMHVETDAPFLAPVPQRGRANTSAYMIHTAEYLAQLKQVSLEEFKNQMWKNAQKIFPRLTN